MLYIEEDLQNFSFMSCEYRINVMCNKHEMDIVKPSIWLRGTTDTENDVLTIGASSSVAVQHQILQKMLHPHIDANIVVNQVIAIPVQKPE